MTQSEQEHYDAIVVGAGITGMYQLYVLREKGFSVKGYDSAGDFGGTWYWNRYPGCRLDTEGYTYAYLFLKGLIPEWRFKELFMGQPELLDMCKHAAEKMDLYKDFQFNTWVKSFIYDEQANRWNVEFEDGNKASCTYLISAIGFLSAVKKPDIEGIDTFNGESITSARWPRDPNGSGAQEIDFSGKRVGVIGTGATGVQIIAEVAKSAGDLYVFQRHPNWCTPLGNRPLTDDEVSDIKKNREKILEHVMNTPIGFPHSPIDKAATEDTEEERRAFFGELYKKSGYAIWLGGYNDLFTNKESAKSLGDFVADKIRERVNDPEVAEKLIPKDHLFGTKRVPMETKYYEVYNQDNVHLVDISENPIETVNADGIKTTAEQYDLDYIIYATGFDALAGSFDRIDIRGKDGLTLKEFWADGPVTYLGMQSRGFPNFFALVGPHNGSSFCNIGVCGGLQAEWTADMISYMRDKGLNYSEPTVEAEDKWTDLVYKVFARTILVDTIAWWTKIVQNADGTETHRVMAWLGGGPEYRQICDDVEKKGYEGFDLKAV